MTFMDAVKSCFSKYVTFSGRAARSEFWWFVLFYFVAGTILALIDLSIFGTDETGQVNGLFSTIFAVGVLLPAISVAVRRLHDINRSGWWYWIALIPIIGALVLIYLFIQKGSDGTNDFGEDPLANQ